MSTDPKPNSVSIRSINTPRSTEASPRSCRSATARPPSASIRATVSSSDPTVPSPGWAVRAMATTAAPSATSRMAMALPIPRLAPVTTATRPAHASPMGGILARMTDDEARREANFDLYRRMRAAQHSGNKDAWLACFADDIVFEAPYYHHDGPMASGIDRM